MREYARGCGDVSLERACNVDLARYGYRDGATRGEPLETTEAVVEGQEQVVPASPKRGGRPKMPRCEHDNIVGRCPACDKEDNDDE